MDYDVVIVGAGPAGLMTCEHSAKQGAKTLVIDRKKEIGVPVRCAEGLGRSTFKELGLEENPNWIFNVTKGVKIISPKGRELSIKVPYEEYQINILSRSEFEKMLASRALSGGGEILLDENAIGLLKENGKILGVRTEMREIFSKVIIGADGVESRIGRWSGLAKRLPLTEIFSAAQYTLTDIDLDPEFIEIHFNSEFAPGGYAWIFPRGKDEANLGIGITGFDTNRAIEYLQLFKENRGKDATPIRLTTGCIPSSLPLDKTVKDNVILVGDAAYQTNAVSGGGIANSLKAGKIAGEVVGKVVVENRAISGLYEYEILWREKLQKNLKKKYKQKRLLRNDRSAESGCRILRLANSLRWMLPKSVLVHWLKPMF